MVVEYELSYKDGNKDHKIGKALICWKSNIDGLNMEKAGVSLSKRGVHIGD